MPIEDDLIAYYKADAVDPTADDFGSYTATLTDITNVPGKFDQAWGFALSTSGSNTGSTPNVGTYTLSGWGYNIRAGWAAFAYNLAGGANLNWYMAVNTGTNELGVYSNGGFTGTGYTVVPASLAGWHHYAVTRDAATGNVVLYVDGSQAGAVINPTFSGTFRVSIIGNQPGGTDYRWAERIDDFAIWNRALASSEINDIYTQGNLGRNLRDIIDNPTGGGGGGTIQGSVIQSRKLQGDNLQGDT